MKQNLTPSKMAQLFGENKKDIQISKPITKKQVEYDVLSYALSKTEEVLLFVAYIRLDALSLYSPYMKFTKLENCVHPDNMLTKIPKENDHIHTMLNPLTDEILLRYSTSIEVDIEISLPFKIPGYILSSIEYYRRIIVVLYDKSLAQEVLSKVLLYNQNIVGPNIIIPNYFAHNKWNFDEVTYLGNIITGFVVDVENFYVMFFEGLTNGNIRDIWLQVQMTKTAEAKIFYRSDSVFEKRLYYDFIAYGGIYTVTVQMGLKFVIKNKNIFLSGAHSLECRRVSLNSLLNYHTTDC